MENKIKIIVHHYSSRTDMNGSRHWFTHLTSTKSGESFCFTTPHNSNSDHFLRRLGLGWESTHTITQELPIREFNQVKKHLVDTPQIYDTQEIMDKIAALLELEPVSMG